MNILAVVLINVSFLIVPLASGFLCGRLFGRYCDWAMTSGGLERLRVVAFCAVFAGYAMALLLARMQWLSHPASLLCGAILFVPGLFALAVSLAARRPTESDE